MSVSRDPSVMMSRTRHVTHFLVVWMGWLEAKCVDSGVLTVELGWTKIGIFK